MARVTREEVQALMNDPRIQAFLDMISWAEGTSGIGNLQGYNVLFGGGTTSDLSGHPKVTQGFYDKTHNSTASGRYQITNPTYQEFAKKLGITDFSPRSQDEVAVGIIIDSGAVNDILSGNLGNATTRLTSRWDAFRVRRPEDIYDSYNAALGQRSSGQAQPLQMTAQPNVNRRGTPSFSTQFATGEHYTTPTIPGGINFTQPIGMNLPAPPGMPTAPPADSNIQSRISAAMSTPRLALSTDALSPATIANMEEALTSPREGTPITSFPTSQFTSPTNTALVGMPTMQERQRPSYNELIMPEPTGQAVAVPTGFGTGQPYRNMVSGPVSTEPFVSQFSPNFEPEPVAVTGLAGGITPAALQAAMNWQQAGASLVDDRTDAELTAAITQAQQVNDWIANMKNQLSNIGSGVINNPLASTQRWPNVLDAQILRALETTQVPPVGA